MRDAFEAFLMMLALGMYVPQSPSQSGVDGPRNISVTDAAAVLWMYDQCDECQQRRWSSFKKHVHVSCDILALQRYRPLC